MQFRTWFGLLLISVSLSMPAMATISEKDPVTQVQLVSNQLVSRIESERKQLEASNDRVNALAEELVFPYIDITKMSRFVLGVHWRTATPEQQKTFVDLFKRLLLNSYARSFLKLQIDHIDFGASRAGNWWSDGSSNHALARKRKLPGQRARNRICCLGSNHRRNGCNRTSAWWLASN